MTKTALHGRPGSLVIAAAILLTGCANEASVGPDRSPAFLARISTTGANASRDVDLGACSDLQAPSGSKLAFRTYARGVQIYHWNGTAWAFDGPLATLSADAGGKSTVGTHYAGPTWKSNSGSKVVGTMLKKCIADANSVPWLLLGAVSAEGPGIFSNIRFIQRVNTSGGNPPTYTGMIGEEARVPYTTEYFFYR